MDKSTFVSLPLSAALDCIWEANKKGFTLEQMHPPEVPRMPRFDGKLSRKGGTYCWMSEMDLDSLLWWHNKKQQSSQEGGQYAAKDEKTATALGYWLKYRQAEPLKPFVGERDHKHETGAAPSASPKLHSWDDKPKAEPAGGAASDPAYGGDDSLPFALNVTGESAERWHRA